MRQGHTRIMSSAARYALCPPIRLLRSRVAAPSSKHFSFPCRLRQDISKLKISKCFLPALVTVIVTVCIFDSFEVYNSTAAG